MRYYMTLYLKGLKNCSFFCKTFKKNLPNFGENPSFIELGIEIAGFGWPGLDIRSGGLYGPAALKLQRSIAPF